MYFVNVLVLYFKDVTFVSGTNLYTVVWASVLEVQVENDCCIHPEQCSSNIAPLLDATRLAENLLANISSSKAKKSNS